MSITGLRNGPSPEPSPQGRRILIAVVGGEAGRRIQAWRQRHDPVQARRLPPHATLSYWAPAVAPVLLERQVRHAFPSTIAVSLGPVQEFGGEENGFYIAVLGTEELDAARERLYDGRFLDMGAPGTWPWHVTCVRDSRGRDVASLREAAAELTLDTPWIINEISYRKLRGDAYLPLATWRIEGSGGR